MSGNTTENRGVRLFEWFAGLMRPVVGVWDSLRRQRREEERLREQGDVERNARACAAAAVAVEAVTLGRAIQDQAPRIVAQHRGLAISFGGLGGSRLKLATDEVQTLDAEASSLTAQAVKYTRPVDVMELASVQDIERLIVRLQGALARLRVIDAGFRQKSDQLQQQIAAEAARQPRT